MQSKDFEIHINDMPWLGVTQIWFSIMNPDGSRSICEPMEMKFTRYEPGIANPEKASLTIGSYVSYNFLKGLANALDKKGIKPESDSFTQGKLIATEKHLEDMRKIVFDEINKEVPNDK